MAMTWGDGINDVSRMLEEFDFMEFKGATQEEEQQRREREIMKQTGTQLKVETPSSNIVDALIPVPPKLYDQIAHTSP